MKAQLRPAISLLALLTIITGVIYPLIVTGLAQILFPHQANGSLIVMDGKTYGSELIGQQFAPKNISGHRIADRSVPNRKLCRP